MRRLIALAWIVAGLAAYAVLILASLALVGGVLAWIWTERVVWLKVAATGCIAAAVVYALASLAPVTLED